MYLRDKIIPYAQANVDDFGDSYTSPVNVDELRNVLPSAVETFNPEIITKMEIPNRLCAHSDNPLDEMFREEDDIHSLGRLFTGCVAYLDYTAGQSGISGFAEHLLVILTGQ